MKHYLDHAATTPLHPRVIQVMTEQMQQYANPSSLYQDAHLQKQVIRQARECIAQEIHAKEEEIIFTGSGSEGNNTVIQSVVHQHLQEKGHFITSAIEHPSVRNTMKWAESLGFEVTFLPVDESGVVSLSDVRAAIKDTTCLISLMWINNETGSRQPIEEVSLLAKERGILMHTDAVQAFGHERIDVEKCGVDYLTASAHKINGPKGVGFLYKRTSAPLVSLVKGGGQEFGFRAGTENVIGIAGFKEALIETQATRVQQNALQEELGEYLASCLKKENILFEWNARTTSNSSHVWNLWVKGVKASQMMIVCDLAEIAVSAGSACSAGSLEASPVLTACYGKESDRIWESIRLSFGYGSSKADVEAFVQAILPLAKKVQR